jgi:hypothetical protein
LYDDENLALKVAGAQDQHDDLTSIFYFPCTQTKKTKIYRPCFFLLNWLAFSTLLLTVQNTALHAKKKGAGGI